MGEEVRKHEIRLATDNAINSRAPPCIRDSAAITGYFSPGIAPRISARVSRGYVSFYSNDRREKRRREKEREREREGGMEWERKVAVWQKRTMLTISRKSRELRVAVINETARSNLNYLSLHR